MSIEPVWCSIVFPLVASANSSGSSKATMYNVCSAHRGYHEYIGGHHEYIRGCSVHWRDTMMHVRDIMIHVGGYDEYIRGGSGSQYKSKALINFLPHMNHDVLMTSL